MPELILAGSVLVIKLSSLQPVISYMMVLATIALVLENPYSYRKLDSFHDFTFYNWLSFGAFLTNLTQLQRWNPEESKPGSCRSS